MKDTATGLVASTIAFSNVDGPGNRFVVFLQGCNFDCVACHNPQTIPHATGDHFVTDLDDVLAAGDLSGITVSGGEATQQAGFVHALFTAVKDDLSLAHLTCFVDSNGACGPDTWAGLSPVMDGAMIDLKCLDAQIHQQMTGQPNDEVLASIRQVHALGLLYEVRLLILAGVNNGTELVQRLGALMLEALEEAGLPYYAEKDYFLSAPDDPPGRPDAYGVSSDFMFRRSLTIYGGSNEVQRNIIAGTLLRK